MATIADIILDTTGTLSPLDWDESESDEMDAPEGFESSAILFDPWIGA